MKTLDRLARVVRIRSGGPYAAARSFSSAGRETSIRGTSFTACGRRMIVQHLFPILPEGYVAAPGVHLGAAFEIDLSTYEEDGPARRRKAGAGSGGVAVAAWAPPKPTLTLEAELPDQDEYEVRVYDERHGRRLVAAIEIVSPSNKDRPESRRAFVAKVAALLQRDVCVSIVDIVTIRQFNLYADLLELIGESDPMLGAEPPGLYTPSRFAGANAPASGH